MDSSEYWRKQASVTADPSKLKAMECRKNGKSVATYDDIVRITLANQKKWINRFHGHDIFDD